MASRMSSVVAAAAAERDPDLVARVRRLFGARVANHDDELVKAGHGRVPRRARGRARRTPREARRSPSAPTRPPSFRRRQKTWSGVYGAHLPRPDICAILAYGFAGTADPAQVRRVRDRFAKEAYPQVLTKGPARPKP